MRYGDRTVITLDMVERMEILRGAMMVLSKLTFVREVYLFGSMLDGKITGASDIDLLIVIDSVDPKRAYIEIALALEEELGERAYIIDIHVVSKNLLDEQPFKWLHKNSKKIL